MCQPPESASSSRRTPTWRAWPRRSALRPWSLSPEVLDPGPSAPSSLAHRDEAAQDRAYRTIRGQSSAAGWVTFVLWKPPDLLWEASETPPSRRPWAWCARSRWSGSPMTSDLEAPPSRPRMYLVRHGETDWNATDRLLSRTDQPMNADGEAQAAELAVALAGISWDRAVASPMVRARRTAEIILTRRDDAPDLLSRSHGRPPARAQPRRPSATSRCCLWAGVPRGTLRHRRRRRTTPWRPDGRRPDRRWSQRRTG